VSVVVEVRVRQRREHAPLEEALGAVIFLRKMEQIIKIL
jgi:hypothetical protein